jgi:ADP-ribosylglycohydrolase
MDQNIRIESAIWGQLIGDAIALGTHWIYDPVQMQKEFPDIKGFETPKSGHYHAGKVSGDSTHYGEACRLILESIAENKKFDAKDFANRFKEFYGSSSYKGYVDRAARGTLHNMERKIEPSGADDDQMAAAAYLAPVIAMYFDSEDLERKVEEATLVVQNNPKTLAYMLCNARILKDLLQGIKLKDALEKQVHDPVAGEGIKEALGFNKDPIDAMKYFGLSCHLDEAFPSTVFFGARFGESFEDALLANTRSGGDSAGRGAMLGAWLGAYRGVREIPFNWIKKIRDNENIANWIKTLIQARKS